MKFSKIFLIGVFETQSRIRRSYHWFRHTVRKFSRNLSLIFRRFFSSSTLMVSIIGLLVLLLVGFVSVMFSKTVEEYIGTLLGLTERKQKNEILTFLGIGMGGVLVALQALMSYRRANAMEGTVQNTEKGLRQERLKNAIEHLGNDSDSVRLGGAYELFHLAQDTKKEALQRMRSSDGADERFHLAQDTPDLRQTVLDILCAHIRRTTGDDKYRNTHQSKPSQEMQSLLTLLFVQDHDVFEGLPINLQESWLNGANLRGARLRKANLTRASLQKTVLIEAQLQEVILFGAHLHEVNLTNTHLQGAILYKAQLHGATLNSAKLHGASLYGAILYGAEMMGTQLQGVDLTLAKLQGAILSVAQLQEANLIGTQLQGVRCQLYQYVEFEKIMRQSIDQQSDLSTVIFAGGLTNKELDSIVEELSDEKARELRKKLEPHIGKPISNNLPENNHDNTGAYTREEAEKWIVEYKKAMSKEPTRNDVQ